jgi:hypothetical protein
MRPDQQEDRRADSGEADHSGVLIAFGVMALSGAVVGFFIGLWVAG